MTKSEDIWTVSDIGSYFGWAYGTALRRTAHPSFPKPINRIGHKRWHKEVVVAWAKKERRA